MIDTPLSDAIVRSIELLPEPARPADLQERVTAYLEAVLETNRVINLVSRRDTPVHLARFTHECLFLARCLQEDATRFGDAGDSGGLRLIDLGSGGGFPGVLLKLALPDVHVTLVESTQKKARFLAEVARKLDLRGLTVICGRAEDLADKHGPMFRPEFRHHFHWATSKGLGTLRSATRLAHPFLTEGGAHWTFKGRRLQEEQRGARRFFAQARLEMQPPIALPEQDHSWLVAIRRLPPQPS